MKIGHVLPVRFVALVCYYSILCLSDETLASIQITFVQPTSQNQDQPPNQQTLPPEKKKSLPSLGPDELFPGDKEQPTPASQNMRSPKRQRSTARSSAATITAPAAEPNVISPNLSPTLSQQTLNPLPATAPAGITFETQRLSQSLNDWQIPTLGFLSVVIFFGLLYVLAKLRELLRGGSS